jgi:hypothetical protein
MAQYRVGPNGATVFNEAGEALARLRPGWVVVEGTTDTAKPPAAVERGRKQVRGYADKVIRPEEDKS